METTATWRDCPGPDPKLWGPRVMVLHESRVLKNILAHAFWPVPPTVLETPLPPHHLCTKRDAARPDAAASSTPRSVSFQLPALA